MKLTAPVKVLSGALTAAASLAGAEGRRKLFPAFEAIRISAELDGVATIASSVGDFSLLTTIPATVSAPGALALPGGKLAGLVGAFPNDAQVEISASDSIGIVACAKARYRFPSIPLADLPAPLAISKETGRIALGHDDVVRLTAPAFAISTEVTRYYLCGLLVHDDGRDLIGIATDGFRLAKVTLPGMAGLSSDRSLIIPDHAVQVIGKLIGNVETVTLSRSETLFRVEAGPFVFTSKRIDGTFPVYERVIPPPSDAFVIVDRRELAQALDRLKAATAGDKATPAAGLWWDQGASELHVVIAGASDMADDVVTTSAAGEPGRVAVNLEWLIEQVDEFLDDRIRFDAGDGMSAGAVRISSPDNPNFVSMLALIRWPADKIETIENPLPEKAKRRKSK